MPEEKVLAEVLDVDLDKMARDQKLDYDNRRDVNRDAKALKARLDDPKVAAEVAAYVQYITPVQGVKEEIAKIDPTLVENELIFPTDQTLSQVKIFMPLTPAQQTKYEQQFQQLIGN